MNEETSLLEDPASPRPCTSLQKVSYGLGHVYNDLCAAVWFSYTLFYFQIVLQMDPTTAGALIMIGQVADSMATPAAGWAVDWIGTPRAWHLTGTFVVAVGFSFIFAYNPGAKNWWSLIYYGAFVIFFQVGWAIVQISHLSVITRISRNNEHSSDLTAIRYTASVCCNIFVYILTWIILKNSIKPDNIDSNDFYKFKEIVLIITGIGIFCSVLFYCGINSKPDEEYQEIVNHNHDEQNTTTDKSGNKKSFLKSLVTYQVSIMYMSSRLYTTLNLIYIPLYLDERISPTETNVESLRSVIATVPLVCFLSSFGTSVFLKNRRASLNDQVVYGLGSVFALAGCIWVGAGIPHYTNVPIYIVATIIGIGGSATMVTSLCLTAQFVNNNGFKGGSVYSTVTFTDKLISGAVVFIIQHLECGSKDDCPNFYEDVLAYATGFAAILGLVSLVTLHFQNPDLIHR